MIDAFLEIQQLTALARLESTLVIAAVFAAVSDRIRPMAVAALASLFVWDLGTIAVAIFTSP